MQNVRIERLENVEEAVPFNAYVRKLSDETRFELRSGAPANDISVTAYDESSSSIKLCMGKWQPALAQFDAVELKAGFVQISAFHDLICAARPQQRKFRKGGL